jgi:ABC-type glycerol-3-phosphate transport system substrate-binding protein
MRYDLLIDLSLSQSGKLQQRFLAGFLVFLLLFAASCSPGASNVGESVVLSFAFRADSDQEAYFESLRDEFHLENPTIDIQFKVMEDMGGLPSESLAKLADVIYLEGISPALLSGFMAVQPLVDSSTDFNPEDFWPGLLEACSDQQGNLYGVPISVSPVGIYYDPEIFDQYQVPYPGLGWTWTDFQQVFAKFLSGNAEDHLYVFLDHPVYSILNPFMDAKLQANEGAIEPEDMAASVDWYLQLVKEQRLFPQQSAVENRGTGYYEQWNALIDNGQAAMWIDSLDFAIPGASEEKGVFVPFPVGTPEDHTTPVHFTCGTISTGSKYPKQAWAWLNYLSHQATSEDKTSGKLPPRISTADSHGYWDGMGKGESDAMRFALEHAWYASVQPETLHALTAAVQRSIHSGTDLVTELRAVEMALNTPQTKQPSPTVEPFVVNTPEPTQAAETERIRFLANWGFGDYYQKLVSLGAEFESTHPDIEILLPRGFSAPDGEFLPKLASGYDCFAFESPRWETLSDEDLLDLTPFLEANPALEDDFPGTFLEPFKVDGKLYALPADVRVEYIAFNIDLLTERGLPLPELGWRFEDMMDLAIQVADKSAPEPVFGLAASKDWLLQAREVQWYDSSVQPPYALLNTPELSAALEWLNQLYVEGVFLPAYGASLPEERKPKDYPPYEQAKSKGQVALWVTSHDEEFEETVDFEIGYISLPVMLSGASISYPLMIMGYYISRFSDQPEACWEWIKFLSDHQSVFGGYSPRMSVLEGRFTGEDNGRFEAVQGAVKQYVNYVYADQYNPLILPYAVELWAAELRVLQGENVSLVLAEAQRKADAYLACISKKDLSGLDDTQLYDQIASPCTGSDQQ